MYEAVRASEASTPSRLAATAARAGYDGVVLRNARTAVADVAALREAVDCDVVVAAEVVADDPQSARGHVGNYRPDVTLLVVRGGSVATNRFAVESPKVDVLARPMHGDGDVNHVLLRAAAENDVHVEVNLGPVLRSTGGPRVRAIRSLRKLAELVDAYDTPHVVSADPGDHLEVRAPREVVAVGEAAGLDPAFVREGLAAWGALAERRRREQSPEWVAPGVRVVDAVDEADAGDPERVDDGDSERADDGRAEGDAP
ncbi:MAG: RNase P subunit p30 family protein [Halobacteriaceae archaeon]